MRQLTVDLGDRSYPIYIGSHSLSDPQLLLSHIKGRQVCVVSNETVAPLYLERVKTALKALQCDTVVLPDGEKYKDLKTLDVIFDALLEKRHNRNTTLLALGGGVVGDMTGFAASAYQRGVDFIQVPTTLLSQVDSSVGGKTGVNHPLGKNMIGAFHQPNCVVIDTSTLSSLPSRELSAGIAEVIKYGLIGDEAFFEWLENNVQALLSRDQSALAYAIERSCLNKADIVAMDEKESGIRAILNLGHTFGHAIETHQGYGRWLHGEAVAVGMAMAADLSQRMGWLKSAHVVRIKRLLEQADLPVSPPVDMEAEQFIALMSVDKKVLDGRLRLVLLRAVGEAVICDDVDRALLLETLSAFRQASM